ncbi:MAG: hypothetical protein KZQ96_23005 [Candidatus Thiodiazotropha sp. (ex Lucinoma borealis)]|nr:hypothetical protein [Candidatus Thiodiazotropha sp. (ex Lucinoma borealis)]
MSNMHRLLMKLPSVPVLCSGTRDQVTPEEIETLSSISNMIEEEAVSLMIGVSELSRIISEAALDDVAANQDRIIFLSCMQDVAISTVDGLRFIESEADAILARFRAEGGES